MKAKPKKKVAALPVIPEGCIFFLADDIRLEHDGKPSLLGMYPDNTVVFSLPKATPDPSPSKPFYSPGLSVLAHFPGANGSYEMALELQGPNGHVIGRSEGDKLVGDRESINFVTRFSPFPVVGLGHYILKIALNKKPYVFDFYVRRLAERLVTPPVRILPPTELVMPKPSKQKSKKK